MRKTANDVRKILAHEYVQECVDNMSLFDVPAYAKAIVGITHNDRVIYDYNKMIECLMEEDGMEADEAMEFIDYNTIRTLPYMPNAPIILMTPITIE